MTAPSPPLGQAEDLAEVMNGEWTVKPDRPIRHIRADIDLIEPGLQDYLLVPELFHRRIGIARDNSLLTCLTAWERGASGFIVTERPRNLAAGIPCLIVEDIADAIAQLAEHRRSTTQAKFVAVTGSAGKSTTKEMAASLLSSKGNTVRSIFNYNAGRDSLEFTLANLSPAHGFCSVEFSAVGSIEIQGEIYRPDVAIITNILWEHAARFEESGLAGEQIIDAIIERKTSLVRNLAEGGHFVVNRDSPYFEKQCQAVAERTDVHLVTFGEHPDADVRLVGCDLEADGSHVRASIRGREYAYSLAIPGKHMALNSLAALAAADALNVDLEPALAELAGLTPGSRRGEICQVPWGNGSITAINDTVSSSIPATSALFRTLSRRETEPNGRRILILGDIGELGTSLLENMKSFAEEAATFPIDRFYTIGEGIQNFNRAFPDRSRIAPHAGSLDRLYRMLEADIRPGDTVAFKGSMAQGGFSQRRLWKLIVGSRLAGAEPQAVNPKPAQEVRVVIGGDTYLGESYQQSRARMGLTNYLEAFGYDYSGEKLKPLFQRADSVIINLECALTHLEESPLEGRKGYILAGEPEATTGALKTLGVDAVLLGNNHTMDYGEQGLRDTLAALDSAGIAATGAGPDKMTSQAPYTCEFERAGSTFKLAVVSGYEFNERHEKEYRFYSGERRWGVNNINIPRLREQVAGLKDDGYFVIVSPHWGENYCLRNYDQQHLASRMIYDCRADLIIGHGPHVYNEFGKTGANWVLYSIGNLIFNSEGEYARRQISPYSFMTELVTGFQPAGWRVTMNLYPIMSCNQISHFQPDFLDEVEFERFAGLLKAQFYDPFQFDETVSLQQEEGRNFLQFQVV